MLTDDAKAKSSETPCPEKVEFAKIWVKRLMEQMDQNLDEETRTKLMNSNGRACYHGAYGDNRKAKDENGYL